MADYGHEPTETAVPWQAFKDAGFEIHFATETGKTPECDRKLVQGVIQKLLGAKKIALECYARMKASPECISPHAWTAPDFSLDAYDLVYLPGGHEKSVRQIIDSAEVHKLFVEHWPKIRKPEAKKAVVAVCHGVMVLSESKDEDGKSVLYECDTTSLPARFEQVAFWGTRAFLGEYYKTYGAGSEDVEESVRKSLKDDKVQYKNSLGMKPFVVVDSNYNYISARFPNDVDMMSEMAVKLVRSFHSNE